MARTKSDRSLIIPNQVFIGCPWKTVHSKYQQAIDSLKNKFPLSFVIVGRDEDQDAEDLLTIIKGKLVSSSYAIFDATGGNANVSLEYGYAEAIDLPRTLYLSSHEASHRSTTDSPIIADLAGKRQMRYKQINRLKSLLTTFAKTHNYTKQFEQFLKKEFRRAVKGDKKRARSLALKIIHSLDEQEKVRREDIIQQMLADPSDYKRDEIDLMIRRLHTAGLIISVKGRYSTVSMI
jgi:hypothetical protein